MNPFTLGNDTITRVRAPLVVNTRDNSKSRDWTQATSLPIPGCVVEPFRPSMAARGMIEVNTGREFEQQPIRVYAPATTDVVYTDRIVWQGKTYDVVTDPAGWTDLWGTLTHYVLIIRLRVG